MKRANEMIKTDIAMDTLEKLYSILCGWQTISLGSEDTAKGRLALTANVCCVTLIQPPCDANIWIIMDIYPVLTYIVFQVHHAKVFKRSCFGMSCPGLSILQFALKFGKLECMHPFQRKSYKCWHGSLRCLNSSSALSSKISASTKPIVTSETGAIPSHAPPKMILRNELKVWKGFVSKKQFAFEVNGCQQPSTRSKIWSPSHPSPETIHHWGFCKVPMCPQLPNSSLSGILLRASKRIRGKPPRYPMWLPEKCGTLYWHPRMDCMEPEDSDVSWLPRPR